MINALKSWVREHLAPQPNQDPVTAEERERRLWQAEEQKRRLERRVFLLEGQQLSGASGPHDEPEGDRCQK